MNEPPNNTRAEFRNRSIRGAVCTSILSKIGTLLLRIISIPVAIKVLGMDLFGVYATILVAVQMIDVFHVGIGPALTQKLSKASLANDQKREAQLFSTSFLISVAFTLIATVFIGILITTVPIPDLFGEKYAPFADSMKRASLIGLLIIAVEVVCLVAEKARDGYMETRYTNSWGAGGNLLGAVLLLVGIAVFPTIEFLVIAINGSVVAAKLGNTIHMLVQRPYLLPSIRTFSVPLIKPLMGGALIFTIVYATSCVAEYNGIAYLVGRYLGPESIANYSILVTLHVSLTGIIQMVTIPMWPAVIDAYERKEFSWVKKGATRLQALGILFGICVAMGSTLLGTRAVHLWVGKDFTLGSVAMALFGLYFSLHIWRHVNQMLCLGLSKEKPVAVLIILESTCVIGSAWWLLHSGMQITHVLAAICVSLLCFSAWVFPALYRTTFRIEKERYERTHPERHHLSAERSDNEAVVTGA